MMSSYYGVEWEPIKSKNETPEVQLWYPRVEGNAKEILVQLSDVRAADDILVSYDFGRDGWVIKQASVFAWTVDDTEYDDGWKEVAFIQAWALEDTKP